MKIAILGSGGREHAIVHQISKSKKTSKIYCIPGNAGTESLAENINLNLDNFEEIYNFIKEKNIDLVIVGPEKPLVNGITDFLNETSLKEYAAKIDFEKAKIYGKSDFPNHPDTIYLSVRDKNGMTISFINSLFDTFGSGITAPKSGILFHCRGRGFNLIEGHPNELHPNKKPLHTIIPGMISKKKHKPTNAAIWRRCRAEISHMRPIQGKKLKLFEACISGVLALCSAYRTQKKRL